MQINIALHFTTIIKCDALILCNHTVFIFLFLFENGHQHHSFFENYACFSFLINSVEWEHETVRHTGVFMLNRFFFR